mmetsp:Transcript_41655/g.94003  ORF Transcript_41655/g.94003 Transcript_41655/m.94003 type:complete len:296 (+) Transcript_41655:6484-7371(+)
MPLPARGPHRQPTQNRGRWGAARAHPPVSLPRLGGAAIRGHGPVQRVHAPGQQAPAGEDGGLTTTGGHAWQPVKPSTAVRDHVLVQPHLGQGESGASGQAGRVAASDPPRGLARLRRAAVRGNDPVQLGRQPCKPRTHRQSGGAAALDSNGQLAATRGAAGLRAGPLQLELCSVQSSGHGPRRSAHRARDAHREPGRGLRAVCGDDALQPGRQPRDPRRSHQGRRPAGRHRAHQERRPGGAAVRGDLPLQHGEPSDNPGAGGSPRRPAPALGPGHLARRGLPEARANGAHEHHRE